MKTKKTYKKKGILLALMITALITCGITTTCFASSNEGEIEREFTIDMNGNGYPKDEFTVDVNKPKAPDNVEDGFTVDVNKPDSGKPVVKEEDFTVDVNKPKPKTPSKPGKDIYKPTPPSKARGTITESVGADNKSYPVRKEITEGNSVATNGQSKERPKADSREFLTFETANGKVFHLIIDRDEDDSNVRLLTEVSEQDLLNMIEQDNEMYGMGTVKEEPEKEVVKKEEPKKEEPKESKGSFLIVLIIVLLAGGAGYYFKVVKPGQENFDEFEDDEIPEGEYTDDYIDEGGSDYSKVEEENTEDKQFTKEDLE